MLEHDWIEVNGQPAAAASAASVLLALPPAQDWLDDRAFLAAFAWSLIAAASLANQIHQWSHAPVPPRWVRPLQRAGLILSPARHARHHRAPHTSDYCIAGGWLNGALDSAGFWRALERAVTRGRARRRAAAAESLSSPDMAQARLDTMKLVEWLAKEVTDDPRALRWFAEPGTDERIARAYRELLAGYQIDPGTILKTTRMLEPHERPGSVEVNEIAFYSICAHHFLPFFGEVDIAYVPGDRILGLGKLPRLVDALARRFQIQEDIVREVAHVMMEHGHARGVRVRARAQHLCMCSRGPASQSSITHTEFALGTLEEG